ncbi:thioredoxin [bacterium I07]|nr:thioredoxin [bacterium I07]
MTLPTSFDDLLKHSQQPVLVDFWAEWCGACKMVSPTIQQIAAEFKGKLLTVKINVDKKKHLAARYQINSIPTIMMFKDGKPVMRLTGAQPLDVIRREVQQRLSV